MHLYEIIYVDDDVVVVDKAPNVPCHPLKDALGTTLIESVGLEFPEVLDLFQGDREGGLCHRIDNGTSGLVLIARKQKVRDDYRSLFQDAKIEKTYLALVKGRVSDPFEVSHPVAHHVKNSKKMVALATPNVRYRSHPQSAQTKGKALLANEQASLVRVQIGAGRRHQIRVHLASLGHPIFGDALYGGPKAQHLLGHALHAETLKLANGKIVEAPCPSLWEAELVSLKLVAVS